LAQAAIALNRSTRSSRSTNDPLSFRPQDAF